MLWKCCTQYASKFGKLSSGHRTRISQFSFQSQRKAMSKNVQSTAIALISHISKVILRILQARLQLYMSHELPDVQVGFRKAEEPEIKLPTSTGSSKRQETFTKNLLLLYLPCRLCGPHQTGKFLKRWEYQTTWPASWEICVQVRKQQSELDMQQQTGSKSGEQYVKAVYCHPAYLTYMHSTSCKIPGWMKHKLESRLPGEISITSDTQMTASLWQNAKRN